MSRRLYFLGVDPDAVSETYNIYSCAEDGTDLVTHEEDVETNHTRLFTPGAYTPGCVGFFRHMFYYPRVNRGRATPFGVVLYDVVYGTEVSFLKGGTHYNAFTGFAESEVSSILDVIATTNNVNENRFIVLYTKSNSANIRGVLSYYFLGLGLGEVSPDDIPNSSAVINGGYVPDPPYDDSPLDVLNLANGAGVYEHVGTLPGSRAVFFNEYDDGTNVKLIQREFSARLGYVGGQLSATMDSSTY